MAEPIRNKRPDAHVAPTPQNTPLNAAPITSHAQQPGFDSIMEEDAKAAQSIFAQNPQLINMIQGRLGSLVGRPSGYIESLPKPVRDRVSALKGFQKDHSKLEAEFQEEVLELEKKYFAKFSPLYQKRFEIVNGVKDPSEAEIKLGEDSDNEEASATTEEKTTSEDIKGIPEFWLSAMKNHVALSEMITERDEAALKHLKDVRMEYLEKPGFRLIFEFSENDFFTNKVLTKTYFYQAESGYGGDFIYDHAEGDKIDWKTDKDLTVRVESKKQRNKTTKQTRIVKKTVPTDSFFNFFTPPVPPTGEEEDDEDLDDEIEARLELDYQLGEDIKEKLIPRAIDWFTGEALAYEEMEDDDLEGEFEDEDDEEDDLSEDQDDSDDSDDDDGTGKPKQEAAECKQS